MFTQTPRNGCVTSAISLKLSECRTLFKGSSKGVLKTKMTSLLQTEWNQFYWFTKLVYKIMMSKITKGQLHLHVTNIICTLIFMKHMLWNICYSNALCLMCIFCYSFWNEYLQKSLLMKKLKVSKQNVITLKLSETKLVK